MRHFQRAGAPLMGMRRPVSAAPPGAVPPPWRVAGGDAVRLAAPFGVMGILNLTPDSFYDGGRHPTGDAERRAVPGAEVLSLGDSQGEDAAGGHDPALADDDGPVVERRLGIKDVHEQLAGKQGVQPHAFALDHVPEAHAALNDDERADAQARHLHAGLHHFIHAALQKLAPPEEPVRAHFAQRLADVGLENDDDEDEERTENILQKP